MKDELQQRREAISDIQRGEQVEALLNNPILQEYFIKMKAAHLAEFENCAFADDETRRELSQRMRLLNLFEGQFFADIKQANKAKTTLTLLDRAKSIIR